MAKITIVNEQDEIIGYEEREGRDPKNIMRVTALWINDPDGNILLAQRSLSKKSSPGKWGPSVAGSVEEGETYESNIHKEAQEELGLVNTELVLGPKIRQSTTHQQFVQCFTAIVSRDYPFVKQDEEVEQIKWFSKEELSALVKNRPETFVSDFETFLTLFS